MAKSKTTEERVDAKEVAALKLDVESVNARTEEIETKVNGVQQHITALSEQFSRLEAVLLADRDKFIAQAKETAPQPQEKEDQGSSFGHDGIPHWRRQVATEPPRYDFQYQEQYDRDQAHLNQFGEDPGQQER